MYFITVFEKLESAPNGAGFPETGCQRTWGYYSDKETALKAVHENWTDMWEFCYNYALIEEIDEGICALYDWRQWFKFDRKRNGYFEIEEPDFMKHYANFAIG